MKTKISAIVNIILALFVLIGLVFSHLALTDISHGLEPDLSAEWWVVRITFLLVSALVFSSIFTARSILRGFK